MSSSSFITARSLVGNIAATVGVTIAKAMRRAKGIKIMKTDGRKTNQNEIRRAAREGTQFTVGGARNFLALYGSGPSVFAVTEERLRWYGESLRVTQAIYQGKLLVGHAYLIDSSIRRARLFLSASLFERTQNHDERQLAGRAHRFLVYREMIYFRDQKITCLDLGGYEPGSPDRKLQGINTFKLGFGGEPAEESDYISYRLYLLRLLAEKVRRKSRARLDTAVL
jgi:hypothetical protein